MKYIKWFLITIFIIFFLIIIGLNVMMSWYQDNDRIHAYFKSHNTTLHVHEDVIDGVGTRYIETEANLSSTDVKKLLVFIHGAPGSAMDFKEFLHDSILLNQFDIISIARLGYGPMEYKKDYYTVLEQCNHIVKQLQQYENRKILLVGHSYGGPIAAYVASKLKNIDKKVFLLAPVIDPQHEMIFWYSSWANKWPFKWILPSSFVVAGYEKMNHAIDLKALESAWADIDFAIVHMHGLKDGLAPVINIEYVKENFPSSFLSQIILADAGHLLPFLNYEEVRDEILKL